MSEGIKFSERGENPTAFETALVKSCEHDGQWEEVARALVVELGPDAATRALVILLDTLGGEKVHVPQRRHFFARMWGRGRVDWIADRQRERWTLEEIGQAIGVDPARVCQIMARARRTKLSSPA